MNGGPKSASLDIQNELEKTTIYRLNDSLTVLLFQYRYVNQLAIVRLYKTH